MSETSKRQPGRHPSALIESQDIGERARIHAFVHVLPGAVIGDDVNLNDYVLVEGGSRIGDRVTIKPCVQVWRGVELEHDVFVGSGASFVNDKLPRSRRWDVALQRTIVQQGASIGTNATVLGGLTIGRGAVVGAGAVVTKNVPPFAVVVGNPASIVAYVGTRDAGDPQASVHVSEGAAGRETRQLELPGGAELIALPGVEDMRGSVAYGQTDAELPFSAERIFFVYGVASRHIRGEHAHRALNQLLICVAGSCSVVLDDGRGRRSEVVLDAPTRGLHIPPMVWSVQYKHSPDAVLAVLASEHYDSDDYIRSYDEFLAVVRGE